MSLDLIAFIVPLPPVKADVMLFASFKTIIVKRLAR
jgi:hypothetical protein